MPELARKAHFHLLFLGRKIVENTNFMNKSIENTINNNSNENVQMQITNEACST